MSLTLDQMVASVRGKLNQFSTTRDQVCTFAGWTLDGSGNKTGVQLADVPGDTIQNAILELGTEQVYVESWDDTTGQAACPPWFRQLEGSPANDAYPPGSRAILNPRWPWWSIAGELANGVNAVYPDLYAVRTTTIITALRSRYQLPADCEDILNIKIEPSVSWLPQQALWQWSMETTAADGNKYLHIVPRYMNGLNMYVTYRTAPIAFTGFSPALTWTSTGLPESASDLPVLYAVSALLPSADAARTQSSSIIQSDANRYVQTGSAGSVSNHFDTQFVNRLAEERKRLADKYVSHVRLVLNG